MERGFDVVQHKENEIVLNRIHGEMMGFLRSMCKARYTVSVGRKCAKVVFAIQDLQRILNNEAVSKYGIQAFENEPYRISTYLAGW
jgi:hypothetical protein